MTNAHGITDLQIMGSKFPRGRRQARRDLGLGGRPLKSRVRVVPRLEPLEDRMLLTTYTVTSTGTTNVAGTLLYAINQLNSTGQSSNIISFNILGSGFQTISPTSGLPEITEQVSIQGNTQPGFSGTPPIVIEGGAAGAGANGLTFGSGSSGSSIQDLAIARFVSDGIDITSSSTGDSVVGCWLGMNSDGAVISGSGATIGGTSTGAANIISGNLLGVVTQAPCLVEGNLIGTDPAGTVAVANYDGIHVEASGATIGGTSTGAANIVSGNTETGVYINASCLVEGNLIGTNAAGTAAVANGDGISAAKGATIGGTSIGAANIISGNTFGVEIGGSCLVEGNLIGTNAAGTAAVANGDDSIYVGATGATIGGSAGTGNIIAFNGGPGVATLPGVTGTTIRYNAIFSNAGPGIDRNDDEGLTPNTPNGANNTPVLTSAASGIISGTLNAAPNGTYIIDFYANLTSDASPTRPQGRDYLTSTAVTTNAAGDAVFNAPYTPFPGLPIFTATATDGAGTTSQFSPPLGFALSATGATFAATTNVPFHGTVASFTSSDPAATAADFTAAINWGDGTASSAGTVVAAPGGFLVSGTHTYTTANPATPVTVTITDTVGGSQATANSLAQVANLFTPVSQSPVFVAGTLYSRVVASFTDSNPQAFPGEFAATINWGDGSASSAGVVSADGAGFDVTGSHTYNFTTTSTVTEPVTVTVTDTRTGATATVNSTATVNPAPITITTKNFAVKGGVLFTGTVASFTDADPRINPAFYRATINWGDGSASSKGTITGTNPFRVKASHRFAPFQNIDLVTITITDQNGRTATGIDRVVDPSAVLDIAAGGLALSPNKPFVGTVATFSDSGPAEPASDYIATINWGKGRKSAGMITGQSGQFVVKAAHKFPRFAGSRPVTVTVTDITDGRTESVSESASYIVFRYEEVRR